MPGRYSFTCTWMFLATLLLPHLVRADVTGAILGTVHDRSNSVIIGARVVATNVETNFSGPMESRPLILCRTASRYLAPALISDLHSA
jgi:hypothetical protein